MMCHGVDIREMSIAEVHGRYWDGTLTPEILTACYLERIQALNPALGAVIAINPLALTQAKKLDQLGDRLKLYGIPVLVKDNIAVDGMQTTAGSLMLYDFVPKSAALVVERLLEHGAIILGKANLPEMAGLLKQCHGFSWRGGIMRNPYNLSGEFYGSGAAAAVAANLCVGALETEPDGSIVALSSATQVYGFKPSFDSALTQGVIPLAKSMDTVGIVARTATDTAILANAITDGKCSPPSHLTLSDFRIGIARMPYFAQARQHVHEFGKSLGRLEQLGATLVDNLSFHTPPDYHTSISSNMKCEFASQITTYLQTQVTRGKHANPSITNLAAIIDYYTAQNHSAASLRPTNCNHQAFSLLRQETQYNFTRLFTRHRLHAIAIPAVAAYIPANVAGYPIITLPLPNSLAISFYAQQGSDALLLKLASLMEASNITHRSPPKFNTT